MVCGTVLYCYVPATNPRCTEFGPEGCYWVESASFTWPEALKDCQQKNGTLAIIKTQATHDFITSTNFL
jgi:hypothetical protein